MANEINQERWKNLRWNIQQTRNRIAAESDSMPGWCQVSILHELLARLESFAGEAVEWMHDPENMPELQTYEVPKRKIYEPNSNFIARRYPPDYARFLTVQQAAHDLGVIWHIYSQRKANVYGLKEITHIIKKMAKNALKPAIDIGLISGEVQIVPYLQKVSSIRLLPYANVALIGMPYWLSRLQPDALTLKKSLAQDLLSIPHEIGHFVYWYGRKQIDDKRAAPARWMKHHLIQTFEEPKVPEKTFPLLLKWSEEIFADVYGVRVAQGASIVSLMDLLLGLHWSNEMWELEDSHPSPLIRPYAPIAALSVSKDPNAIGIATALTESWLSKDVIKSLVTNKNIALPPQLESQGAGSYNNGLITAIQEVAAWTYTNLMPEESKTIPSAPVFTPQTVSDSLLGEWGRSNQDLLKDDDQLSFEIGWQEWVDSVFEEYKDLDLSHYMTDKNKRWIVALSGGGWTEGPASGGNVPI